VPVSAAAPSWPAVLGKLLAGTDLSRDEVTWAFGQILAGEAGDILIAGFAVGLRAKGETVEEMTALADTVAEFGVRLGTEGLEHDRLVDTCGTGGDRAGTINVSTLAAVVAAGAGAPVVKHGNRSASSLCGSADLLEALGVLVDLHPGGVTACLGEAGMGFCFAPRFNPALRHAGPVRRTLGVATTFNFLGPLVNPAGVRRQIVGVSDPAMAARMLGVLQARGAIHAGVVFGHDGLDEITTTGPSTVHELRGGEVRSFTIEPGDFGVAEASSGAIRGGDAARNAEVARRVLDGELGAARDVVVVNAAAALHVAGLADTLAEGVEQAVEALGNGAAARVVERLVKVSQGAHEEGSA
jgi:anthranilate phosphoribosyltransferase